MINLKNDIKKVKATTNLADYSLMIYGQPKLGKSTWVHKVFGDRALFLMTEFREKGLVGANYVHISNWTDYTSALKQLKRDKDLLDQFDVIVIDTVDNLYRFATDYAISHYGVEELGDASYGKDYKYLDDIWQKGLEKVHAVGKSPIFVGHSKHQTVKIVADNESKKALGGSADEIVENGVHYLEYSKAIPDLKEKAFNPINKLIDNIIYMDNRIDENGNNSRVAYLRAAPQYVAGSTFPKIKPVISLNPDDYKKAVEEAVNHFDKSDQTDEDYNQVKPEVDFQAISKEAKDLGMEFVKAGRKDELADVITKYLGETKLNEAKASQFQQVQEITEELKELKNA